MARQWWQFSNWPDDPEPNAVEIWEAGTPPKPCTVFRQAWLNQWVGWNAYIHGSRPDCWIAAYTDPDWYVAWYRRTFHTDPPSRPEKRWLNSLTEHDIEGNAAINKSGCPWFSVAGVQDAGFWLWLGTLSNQMYGLPRSNGQTVEFAESTSFPASLHNGEWHLPDPPQALPYWFLDSGMSLQHNLIYYLRDVRARYDWAGVHEAGYLENQKTKRWEWGRDFEFDGHYWSAVGDPYWKEAEPRYGTNFDIQWSRHRGAPSSIDTWYFDQDCDLSQFNDSNYKYAIVSLNGENVGGDCPFPWPANGGYCHQIFAPGASLNGRLGVDSNRGRTAIGDEDGESYSRIVRVVKYPKDVLPLDYRAPDWPDGTDELFAPST